MIKRTIYIGHPARVHLALGQLCFEQWNDAIEEPGFERDKADAYARWLFNDEPIPAKYLDKDPEQVSIPIEDIGLLILDHPRISITHGLINALTENNSAILVCNDRHLPTALMVSMAANHTYSEKLAFQLNASEPLKKNLWKQTVTAKIQNQAAVLTENGHNTDPLLYLASKVQSGDSSNIEGRAAALYWKQLFQDFGTFTRGRDEDPPNNLLNYGYAVLRAVVARSLVGSGLLPALGIHHRNKYNPYCLADDIMEPYRPLVDRLVIGILRKSGNSIPADLTTELKRELLQIPVLDIHLDGQCSPLMVGMQRTTASLTRCYQNDSRKILYPRLPGQ